MSEIKYSKEQSDIIDFAQKGIQNMIVQAVAGAGKTTTLVECVKNLKDNTKILLLAHNRSTKETLINKIGDKPNIKIYTIHGLAWRMFKEHFNFVPIIDEEKYRKYINTNIKNIGGEIYETLKKPQKMIYKSNIFELLDKGRFNLKQSAKELKKLAIKKYGMKLIGNEYEAVAEILKWGQDNLETVDFIDLLWLPSEKGYFTKHNLADIIMLDEAQDASLAQQDVISRCFKRSTRLFAFGDKDQTINSWCGSDTEAFEHLKDSSIFRRDAIELPLTTNYRCGKKIIEFAKKYTNNSIHAREDADEGEIKYDTYFNEIKDGDMILCRNASPLMMAYLKGINEGKKIYFRGEEIGKNLQQEVDCTEGNSIEEIIFSLKSRLIELWDFLIKESEISENEAMLDNKIISLFDVIKTLEYLPKTVTNRQELEFFIKNIFSDEKKEGIQLSTIHKAKGLEADNVFILCPSLLPSKLAKLDWELEEEKHLQYVMRTRPKNSLNFMSEKEFPPFLAFIETNSFYNELNLIKKEIKK